MASASPPRRRVVETLRRPEGGPGGTRPVVVPPGGTAKAQLEVVATLHQLIATLTALGGEHAPYERPSPHEYLPLLLSAVEAGKLLSISRAKVLDMSARGELPSIRVGGSVRIPRDRLIDWIEKNSFGPSAGASGSTSWANARAED